jgi:hypothetical protein
MGLLVLHLRHKLLELLAAASVGGGGGGGGGESDTWSPFL